MDSNHPPVAAGSRGRPRSTEVDRSILDATLALLVEVGVERLSIEMVAQRAGVGKTSIYRRFTNKQTLILEALEQIKPEMDTSAQGSLHEVLYEVARKFLSQMDTPLGRQMLSLLITTLAGNSDISKSYWEKHSLPKTKEIAAMIAEHRQTEGLRSDANVELAADLLVAFIMYQLLFKPPSTDIADVLKQGIQVILDGLRSHG
ncbi:HTH-type transcriptional repressor ComR [compost metagenome]